MATTINEDLTVNAIIRAQGLGATPVTRSQVVQESGRIFPIELQSFRVWDAFTTVLPGTAASDDLGIIAGAFGTGIPYIVSRELNALGATTGYARTRFTLPHQYVSGGTITIRLCAGMITSVASVSATVDVEAYLCGRSNLVSGADLCTTSATSINSLTFSENSFTITPTSRAAGDTLDLRIAFIGNSATASSHFAAIPFVEALLQVQG